jgi:hypothetical protein
LETAEPPYFFYNNFFLLSYLSFSYFFKFSNQVFLIRFRLTTINTKPFSFQVNTKDKIKIKIKTKQYEKERGMVTGGSCGVVPMMCGDTW